MITAEELADAYEAEVQSRGIPPLPELREARVSLAAGALARLSGKSKAAQKQAYELGVSDGRTCWDGYYGQDKDVVDMLWPAAAEALAEVKP